MATLSGNKIKDTYQSLVKFSDNGNITTSAKQLTDGFGNNSPVWVSTTQVGIGVTPESGLNLHVYGDAKIGSNLTVIGNLVVEGSTTTVGTDTLTVKDPLIVLANNNTSTDAVDIGFYGKYTPSGTTLYSGLFREALTGKYRLFKDLQVEPTTTVNTSGTGYAKADLVIGALEATTGTFSGNISSTGSSISLSNATNPTITVTDTTNSHYLTLQALDGASKIDFLSSLIFEYGAGNTEILRLSSTGADIIGTLDVDDVISVQGSGFGRIEVGGASGGYIDLKAPNSDDYDFRLITSTGGAELYSIDTLKFYTGATTDLAFTIDASQNATFENNVTIPATPTADTHAASKGYVDSQVTAQDLDFSGDNGGTGSVDLDSQVFAINGTANQITTTQSGQSLTIAMPYNITIGGIVNATTFSGQLDGTISSTTTATTQSANDNSTKVATTAYVDSQVGANNELSEVLANGNTTGGTNISVSAGDDITFADNSIAFFGAGNDFYQYHDGTNSYIKNYTGDLTIAQNSNDKDIIFQSDDGLGGVTTYLFLDGSNKRVQFNTDFITGDNNKIVFGNSGDLEIYHDGSNSYIKDAGTGNLWIQGSAQVNIGGANGQIGIQYVEGANVTLRHNNVAKLTTTSTGVSVTGNIKLTGSIMDIRFIESDTTDVNSLIRQQTGLLRFDTISDDEATITTRVALDHSTGNVGIGTTSPTDKLDVAGAIRLTSNISFSSSLAGRIYKSSQHGLAFQGVAGSANNFALFTPAGQLKIVNPVGTDDVSINPESGNVGIGTTSPDSIVEIVGNNPVLTIRDSDTSTSTATSTIRFAESNAGDTLGNYWDVGYSPVNLLSFDFNGSTKMIINSSGDVGIGTTSPDAKLDVNGGLNSTHAIFSGQDGRGLKLSTENTLNNDDGVVYDAQTSTGKHLFKTNGTERMRIDSSGQIQFNEYGSGTFTGTATYRLAVDSSGDVIEIPIGGGAVDGSGAAGQVTVWTDTDTITGYTRFKVYDAGGQIQITDGTRDIRINSGYGGSTAMIGTSSSHDLGFMTGNSQRVTIDSSGNIGIGTSSPSVKLDIVGSDTTGARDVQISGDSSIIGLGTSGDNGPHGLSFGYDSSQTSGMSMYYRTGPEQITFEDSDDDSGNKVMVIGKDGNVGIGTTLPDAKLSLYHATDDVSINVNTGTGGSYPKKTGISFGATSTSLGGDSEFKGGAGIQAINTASSNNPTDLAFWTTSGGSPTERMRIDSSGTIIGTGTYTAGNSIKIFEAERSGGAVAGDWSYDDATTDMSLGTSTSHSFSLKTGNTRALTIDTSQNATFDGNVISKNTFYLENATGQRWQQLFDGNNWNIRYYNGSSWSADALAIDTSQNATFARDVYVTGTTNSNVVISRDNMYLDAGQFYIGADDSVTDDSFRQRTASGSYFIESRKSGTWTNRLQINSAGTLIAGQGATFAGTIQSDDITIVDGTNDINLYLANTSYGIQLDYSAGDMFFRTNGGTRLTIANGGNVGIGVTSPNAKLSLAGGSNINSQNSILYIDTNSYYASGADRYITSSTAARYFQLNGEHIWSNAVSGTAGNVISFTERMRITSGGNIGIGTASPSYKLDVAGVIRATGDIIAFSDKRVKENIKTIDNSLEKVNKLRGVEFNKKGEDKKSIGVIAQEIEKILPEVVSTDDNGMKSVAYGNITGVLIEAIKELKQEIETLKTQINK